MVYVVCVRERDREMVGGSGDGWEGDGGWERKTERRNLERQVG